MVPRALGNGSIVGTAVLQPQSHSGGGGTLSRKGILKRTAAQDAANNWDYELSPSRKDMPDGHGVQHEQQPLQQPQMASNPLATASPDMSLPPPPLSFSMPPPPISGMSSILTRRIRVSSNTWDDTNYYCHL